MRTAPDRSAGHGRRTAGCALAFAATLGFAVSAYAHSPHHVIDDLELSPDYANDTTLFVLVHNYLLRSDDRAGSWTPLVSGIDTPFVLTDIEVSGQLASDDTLFLASGGSGVFKSTDRGDTWQRFNAGLTQLDIGKLFVVEDDSGSYLLAAGSSRGLFASSASEAGWARVLSDDVQITAMGHIDDDGESTIFAGDSHGGIWRSGPGFENWHRVARFESAGAITAFAEDPRAGGPGTLLMGTEKSGLQRVSADGAVLERLPRDWPATTAQCSRRSNPSIRDIETSSDGSRLLVTTWSDALYALNDNGSAWEVLDNGLRCNNQADSRSFLTPHFRDLEIGHNSDWFIGTFEGLFRSVDQGETWVPLETMPVDLIRGMAISGSSGDRHSLLLTTYGGGAYLTSDLGQTWTVMNHGLVSTRLADAAFSPGAGDSGQIHVLARGRLMTASGPGVPWVASDLAYQSFFGWANSQIFGPKNRPVVWPMHIELSPTFATDKTLLLGFRRAGIWHSQDAGASWNRDWVGPTDYVTDMKISPDFSQDLTAFATFRGAGIHVTRDGARTWQPSNDGFEFFAGHDERKSPNHQVDPPLSRAITDAVLAVSPQYAQDRTVFAGSAAGLFRSTDGGKRWQELPVLPVSKYTTVVGLAVSPDYATDRTVIVSVRGRGLYHSKDGGESFVALGRGPQIASLVPTFIAFSPTYASDGIIYAATDWSLWLSRDRGNTWLHVQRPARYEDWRGGYSGPVWFSKGWQLENGAEYSASTQTVTTQPGATAVLNFSGASISWYGDRGPAGGTARVTIDGREVGTVNLSAEHVVNDAIVFSMENLGTGLHEIVVEVLNGRVTIDNFDVGQEYEEH